MLQSFLIKIQYGKWRRCYARLPTTEEAAFFVFLNTVSFCLTGFIESQGTELGTLSLNVFQ